MWDSIDNRIVFHAMPAFVRWMKANHDNRHIHKLVPHGVWLECIVEYCSENRQ
jgi:hypothetical protein